MVAQIISENPTVYKVFDTKVIQDLDGHDVQVVDEDTVLTGTIGVFQDIQVEAQHQLTKANIMLEEINKLNS